MAGFYGRAGITIQDELTPGLQAVPAAIRTLAVVAVMAGGEIVREAAYHQANVSKGKRGHGVNGEHMRDEIKVTLASDRLGGTEISARIGVSMNTIPYAAHQEFGPRGKPYMRPAIDENRQAVHDEMARVMREGMVALSFSSLVRFRRFA